nr:MAG TPA: hypothetical protein [Caudoviricetes sp.]
MAFVSELRQRYELLQCDYRGCGQQQQREQLEWRGPLIPCMCNICSLSRSVWTENNHFCTEGECNHREELP